MMFVHRNVKKPNMAAAQAATKWTSMMESVYKRYAIVSTGDMKEAVAKLERNRKGRDDGFGIRESQRGHRSGSGVVGR